MAGAALLSAYAVEILDSVHYSVRENGVVTKKAAYVAVGSDLDGHKDVLGIWLGATESAIDYYNLDVIISVGYRVKSLRGTQFRIWATERLREYIVKGFTMNDDLLKKAGGGNYWRELLERIWDIRSSEKVFYRQLLDLYATSADYDPKALQSQHFFKVVQNKMHYASHGHTAPEIIARRADADKSFMDLTTFSGDAPGKSDIGILIWPS